MYWVVLILKDFIDQIPSMYDIRLIFVLLISQCLVPLAAKATKVSKHLNKF